MHFWDWKTGYNFQRMQAAVQPGSIDSEAGIFAMVFDHSNTRLITAEADKTIKIYKEDDTAVSVVQMMTLKIKILCQPVMSRKEKKKRNKILAQKCRSLYLIAVSTR